MFPCLARCHFEFFALVPFRQKWELLANQDNYSQHAIITKKNVTSNDRIQVLTVYRFLINWFLTCPRYPAYIVNNAEGSAQHFPPSVFSYCGFEFVRQLSYNAVCLCWQDSTRKKQRTGVFYVS